MVVAADVASAWATYLGHGRPEGLDQAPSSRLDDVAAKTGHAASGWPGILFIQVGLPCRESRPPVALSRRRQPRPAKTDPGNAWAAARARRRRGPDPPPAGG